MHLHHPSLSLNGKYRGKKKFRNAEEAQRARELENNWKELQKKWGVVEQKEKRKTRGVDSGTYVPPKPTYRGAELNRPPSIDSGIKGAVTVKQTQHYTGDRLLGITILHKSCLQPVFSQQEAIDAAKMRRG
jgi:hypothetical protein